MKNFKITFEIHPASQFGLPQGKTTVLPSKPNRHYFSDSYHTQTMTKIGYGSLSKYRSDNEKIKYSFSFNGLGISIEDNFLFVNIESSNQNEAYEKAKHECENFINHLSINHGALFVLKPVLIESDDGIHYPIPKYLNLINVTIYNLENLKNSIIDTRKCLNLSDQRLDRAITYYRYAKFLFEKRNEISNPLSEHYGQIISSVFLNLWKSVSSILGDPSKSEDSDYQKRYKELGFDSSFFKTKVEKIRKLRNNYDVAHYALSNSEIEKIQENFGEADEIALIVIKGYRKYLLNGV